MFWRLRLSWLVFVCGGGFFLWSGQTSLAQSSSLGSSRTSKDSPVNIYKKLERKTIKISDSSSSFRGQGGRFLKSLRVVKGDRLLVRGFSGKLTLVGQDKSRSLSLKAHRVNPRGLKEGSEAWDFSLRREGKQIELIVEGPMSREEWFLGKGMGRPPQFEFILEGPSMPAELHWQEGNIHIQDWKSNLLLTLGKGQVKSYKGEGFYKMNLQDGYLEISSHKGKLNLESYKGRVRIFDSSAFVNLENFSGRSELEKVHGEVHLTSYKGGMTLSHCEGAVYFKNFQSSMRVKELKGSLRGESGQGAVRVSSQKPLDIHLQSEEGAIKLDLPGSGAGVNLGSVKGAIYAPQFLKLLYLPQLKMKRGRLRGKTPGKIYVRTDSGPISLK